MCVQNTDQFVCAALVKPFKSNCSWKKATGNHLHICTSHVYDGASAMTVSSRTCLRAENSSSSSSYDIPVTTQASEALPEPGTTRLPSNAPRPSRGSSCAAF